MAQHILPFILYNASGYHHRVRSVKPLEYTFMHLFDFQKKQRILPVGPFACAECRKIRKKFPIFDIQKIIIIIIKGYQTQTLAYY